MAAVAHDDLRHAQPLGQSDVLLRHAGQRHRRRGLLHGVQVEQVVGCLHHGPHGPRAPQVGAVARTLQGLQVPEPVEVLLHPAAGEGIGGVEVPVGLDVHESERERAARRAQAGLQKTVERDRAAELVAVHHGRDQQVRAGGVGAEPPDPIEPRVARLPAVDVRRRQFDGIGILDGLGHDLATLLGVWLVSRGMSIACHEIRFRT